MTVTGLPTTPIPTASRPRLEIPAVTLLALIPAAAKLVSYPDYPGSDDSFIRVRLFWRDLRRLWEWRRRGSGIRGRGVVLG